MRFPFCIFPSSVASLFLVVSLHASAAANNTPEKTGDSYGSIVIVRPPSVFGGVQAVLSIDGKDKKYATGPSVFAADVKAGDYDVYSVNASKPEATIPVAAGKTQYLVKSNDEAGQLLLAALRSHAADQGELRKIIKTHPSIDAVPDSSEWAA